MVKESDMEKVNEVERIIELSTICLFALCVLQFLIYYYFVPCPPTHFPSMSMITLPTPPTEEGGSSVGGVDSTRVTAH